MCPASLLCCFGSIHLHILRTYLHKLFSASRGNKTNISQQLSSKQTVSDFVLFFKPKVSGIRLQESVGNKNHDCKIALPFPSQGQEIPCSCGLLNANLAIQDLIYTSKRIRGKLGGGFIILPPNNDVTGNKLVVLCHQECRLMRGLWILGKTLMV